MADLTKTTTLVNGDVFDPQVVSDMINAKVKNKAVMTGYIKVDSTLSGVPGSTVTVPRWGYIGEATDLEEGQPIDTTKMAFTTAQYGIKKIGKGVMLTDEAQLSGYGNPMGTATNQIAMSISEKLDNDRVAVLYESKNIVDASSATIKYGAIVDGVDMFGEEEDSRKVILIHSKQKTTLRKDAEFTSADKYQSGVMSTGAIGRVAGCDVVVSNKVRRVSAEVSSSGSVTITAENIKEYQDKVAPGVTLKVGDKVNDLAAGAQYYLNPIIKLNNDNETEDDLTAITYFLKRGNLVEHERETGVGDKIICTAFGMPALTNESKVVILKVKA
ncbi:MAG: N4-gp56 family major capsid protein [Eubacteriales bacterium]